MAPRYSDDEIVQHLNEVFASSEKGTNMSNITVNKIKKPTVQFAQEIILAVLSESGFNMSTNFTRSLNLEMNNGNYGENCLKILQVMVTARKLFDNLALAAMENSFISFGMNDLLQPESKRMKYFLSHFINYWLFCNSQYDVFLEIYTEVEAKANQGLKFDQMIEDAKKEKEDLRKTRATSAVKAEKLNGKMVNDKEKLQKLSEDAHNLKEKRDEVKKEISMMQDNETELDAELQQLEKNEFRLKSMAKSEELKQKMESQLERLQLEEAEKMEQVKAYQKKEEVLSSEDILHAENFENVKILKNLKAKLKLESGDEKSIKQEVKIQHEQLEEIEQKILSVQKSLESLKSEIAIGKKKWEKKSESMKNDLDTYSEHMENLNKGMTEDDMVRHELDSKISEMMMKAEEVQESIEKDKESVEKGHAILFKTYQNFQLKMAEDHEKLKDKWLEIQILNKKKCFYKCISMN